jgi:hypothetical protein
MTMKMIVSGAVDVMSVRLRRHHNGNEIDLAVRDPALRDYGLRKFAYDRCVAAKHSQLETVLVIEMNMQGCDLQVMVRVMRVCQPLRQFARVMIEHVGKRRNTFPAYAIMELCLSETSAREIAERLRPIVVMIGRHEYGQFGREVV